MVRLAKELEMQRSKIEDIFVAGTMAEQFLSAMEGKGVSGNIAGDPSTSQSSTDEVQIPLADASPALGAKIQSGLISPKVEGAIGVSGQSPQGGQGSAPPLKLSPTPMALLL